MKIRTTIVAVVTLAVAAGTFARLPKGQSDDPMAALNGGEMPDPDPAELMGGVANHMDDIHGLLADKRTDAPVQEKEKAVTEDLSVLITALEKQCNGNGNGGNPNPTQGLKKSKLAGGPGGVGDLHDPKASDKQWGALKPKERDQILQSKTDGFPAGYENLLQSYYRRLASEDNTPAAGSAPAGETPGAPPASATPTTRPAAPTGQATP